MGDNSMVSCPPFSLGDRCALSLDSSENEQPTYYPISTNLTGLIVIGVGMNGTARSSWQRLTRIELLHRCFHAVVDLVVCRLHREDV